MSRSNSIINRLPHFFRSDEPDNHLYRLVETFASQVDQAEEDLLYVMREHWVNSAENTGSKGIDSPEKGDLDKIFSLFLEKLGGTELLRQTQGTESDEHYRKRMKGLIQVILGGPSTKSGIRQIVAANLGIIGDDLAARLTKNRIKINEFLPEVKEITFSGIFFGHDIVINNPTQVDIVPDIRIILATTITFPLVNPRIVIRDTGACVTYAGTVLAGNELIFHSTEAVFVNGIRKESISSGDFTLKPGNNAIVFIADIGEDTGRLDLSVFDYSLFDKGNILPVGLFDQVRFNNSVFDPDIPVADITVRCTQLHPGSFTVLVPWDSPGYTVTFTVRQTFLTRIKQLQNVPHNVIESLSSLFYGNHPETPNIFNNLDEIVQKLEGLEPAMANDILTIIIEEAEGADDLFKGMNVDPRAQIRYIVNTIKAAGVSAEVTYEKKFSETHELSDHFSGKGKLRNLPEDEQMNEVNFDVRSIQHPDPGGTTLEPKDNLLLSGVFDYSSFDSLNGFA